MSHEPVPLTTAQTEALRRALVERLAETERSLAGSRDAAKPVDLDEPIGRVSRIDAIAQQEMSQASRQAMTLLAQQLRAALERVEAGTYGECVSCEGNVGYARLTARPEAPFCIDCQARREKRAAER